MAIKFLKITSLISSNKLKWPNCTKTNFILLSKKLEFSTSLYLLEKVKKENDDKNKDVVKKTAYSPPAVLEKDKEIIEKLKIENKLYPFESKWKKFNYNVKYDFKLSMQNIVNFLTGLNVKSNIESTYFPTHSDILIIGGGLIGMSVAYALKSDFLYANDIIILDKNPNAPFESLNLGCGTITHQNFVYEEEIEMSKYCTEFLSSFPIHTAMMKHEGFKVPYEPMGSLVLADDTNAESIFERCKTLEYRGIPVRILNTDELKRKFPWLNVDGISFGSWGPLMEGLIDPWAVVAGMKAKLVNMGVQFVTAEAIDFGLLERTGNFRRLVCRLPDGTYNAIAFSRCVIAAGMGSGKLIDAINACENTILKVRIHEEEKRRYEYCFHNADGPGLNTPIVTNLDGVYFRREGLKNLYVAGVTSVSSEDIESAKISKIFEEKIKPFLTKRVNFKELKLKSGWIDSYASNKGNELGIIGHHPQNLEIFFAIGFTNHGWLYAPAVGRAIMELMFYNNYQTIDMTRFQVENLWLRQHLEAEEKEKKLLESQMDRQALGES